MLALAYDAGLRREELCLLRTDDLDPAHRTVRVRAETTKGRRERGGAVLGADGRPAARLPGRTAPAQHGPRPALPLHRAATAPRRSRCGPGPRWCAAIAIRADVPRFSTHTLRHLCLTDLARAGWELHADRRVRRASQPADDPPVHPSLGPGARGQAGPRHGRGPRLAGGRAGRAAGGATHDRRQLPRTIALGRADAPSW